MKSGSGPDYDVSGSSRYIRFIEYFRGSADDALAVLILNNQVLLSPIVKLELLAGVRKTESNTVMKLCEALRPIESFPSPPECQKLLHRARGSGLFGSIPDLLILADVVRCKAILFSYDEKMNRLAKKLRIRIVE